MKKSLSIVLAILLSVSCCGCTMLYREAAVEADVQPELFVAEPLSVPGEKKTEAEEKGEDAETEENGEENTTLESETAELEALPLAEDDPLYEPATHMYQGLVPIFSYFAFDDKDYDLTALEADDFWLFIAMIATSVHPEYKDETGEIHLGNDQVTEYAETFFGEYYEASGIPSMTGSYSAYADPVNNAVILGAMSLDGYSGVMRTFEESTEYPGFYETQLEISWTEEGEYEAAEKSRSWNLVLEPVETAEGVEREFSFILVSYEQI